MLDFVQNRLKMTTDRLFKIFITYRLHFNRKKHLSEKNLERLDDDWESEYKAIFLMASQLVETLTKNEYICSQKLSVADFAFFNELQNALTIIKTHETYEERDALGPDQDEED